MLTSASPRPAAATPLQISGILFNICSRTLKSRARIVPFNTTESGIILNAFPPWMEQRETTPDWSAASSRDTSICSACTIWEANRMGSITVSGWAPCPPFPFTVIVSSSELPRIAP